MLRLRESQMGCDYAAGARLLGHSQEPFAFLGLREHLFPVLSQLLGQDRIRAIRLIRPEHR